MDSEVEAAESAQEGAERAPSNGILLAAVGVVWMAAMLWSARATITGRADVEMEVTSTAYALPGAISASLVAGAAVALAVLAFLTRGGRTPGVTVRFIIATGAGLGLGALGALSIITINTEGWLYAVVGGTVAAAATIGGALAGLRYPRVIAAVCWGAVAVFVVGFVLNYLQDPLLSALGSGDTAASQTGAASWFALLQSVLSGVAGAVVAYRVLRRARRRSGSDVRWPFYALAGAGPGLLLIVGEALTRTAGSRVLELAGKVSELELTVQQMLSGSRLNNGLIVLFVGAFTGMIAVGRTMGSPAAAPAPAPAPASPPVDPDAIEQEARADEPSTATRPAP
ncbi:Zinc finger and BTB domain-containing protein 17 [Actinoplanes friuliensis DSM 7358]|uniref:Zinc finger and BTB domain-containing protein 17 n=1 Tax=Actinoplanes friuliensis DSM 7358 TaxID=1246995 RepID=U5VRG5_9ACTN|nr:Zinc finger and BTB domain-containing protein 17 [Actinoplanes friuliensis DSM 7358]